MVTEVANNLYVADIDGCRAKGYVIVHASKRPCFDNAVGKKLGPDHPNYLSFESGNDLYLNMIDPIEPLFYREVFDIALRFIENHIKDRKVLVHCNMGTSRSASIAMLYLFRDKGISYREAQNQFLDIYNDYNPGIGIDEWLGWNWHLFKK